MAERRGRESRIADVLEAKSEEIARRFAAGAAQIGAAKGLPAEDVVDSLREYVVELAWTLRRERASGDEDLGKNDTAARHGKQRFELGYDVSALVREYAVVGDLIWDAIIESGIAVELDEVRLLFKYVTRNVADAAMEYGLARDEETRRRTSQHLAFLAHELRNPLGSAHMALGLIRERGEVKPSRALDALDRALSRVATLIDESLVSARLHELAVLEYVDIDVSRLLEELAEDSRADAAAKGVELHLEAEGRLEADVRALRSALSNLIRNAVKFTRVGGEIHVRATAANARIVIEIEDACGGLPDGENKKLFDPFVQIGSDRSGFGLGLAIAKQAVEAHAGELRVHNVPGRGCIFVLDLPEAPPVRGAQSAPRIP